MELKLKLLNQNKGKLPFYFKIIVALDTHVLYNKVIKLIKKEERKMKIDKLVFGWYKTDDFKGSTVKILSFNHTTDEAFHEDYKRQVNELIANGAKHLSILRIANDEDLRGNNNVLSEA